MLYLENCNIKLAHVKRLPNVIGIFHFNAARCHLRSSTKYWDRSDCGSRLNPMRMCWFSLSQQHRDETRNDSQVMLAGCVDGRAVDTTRGVWTRKNQSRFPAAYLSTSAFFFLDLLSIRPFCWLRQRWWSLISNRVYPLSSQSFVASVWVVVSMCFEFRSHSQPVRMRISRASASV